MLTYDLQAIPQSDNVSESKRILKQSEVFHFTDHLFDPHAVRTPVLLLPFFCEDFGGNGASAENWGKFSGRKHLTCFCLYLLTRFVAPQEAVTKLLEKICHVLPPSYRSQCQAIVDKFSKTVMDAFIHYATPETICALLHMCKHEEAPVFGQTLFQGLYLLKNTFEKE